MARFGTWNPLAGNWASQSRMTQVDILSIHTMVGSLASTDSMWRRTGYSGNHSHFGIGGNGECTQWQDTAYRAAANYNGNWHIISVECADVGAPFPAWNTNDGAAVPAFSTPQLETLAQLIAAMCKAHNIPCQLIPDAKPGRRGIGYHRLGVPGYMVAGAEQWSTAQGKVCPGNRRIAQIPQVIARAQQILNGASIMATLDADDLRNIYGAVWNGTAGAPLLRNYRLNNGEWPATTLGALEGRMQNEILPPLLQPIRDQLAALTQKVNSPAPAPVAVNVDATAVAAALGKDAGFLAAIAKAVADENARRQES